MSEELKVIGKKCSICDSYKPLDQFYSSKNTKDGKQPYCKACMSARNSMNRKRRDYEAAKMKAIMAEGSTSKEKTIELIKQCLNELCEAIVDNIKYCELSNKPALKRALIEDIESTTAIKYGEIVVRMTTSE